MLKKSLLVAAAAVTAVAIPSVAQARTYTSVSVGYGTPYYGGYYGGSPYYGGGYGYRRHCWYERRCSGYYPYQRCWKERVCR